MSYLSTESSEFVVALGISFALHVAIFGWIASSHEMPKLLIEPPLQLMFVRQLPIVANPAGSPILPSVPQPILRTAEPTPPPKPVKKLNDTRPRVPSQQELAPTIPTVRHDDVVKNSNSVSQAVAAGTGSTGGVGIVGTGTETGIGYEQFLISKLNQHKLYPERARLLKIEGQVSLLLVLNRQGEVLTSQIHTSSNSQLLDEEVLAMVKRAAPFPSMPAGYRPGETVQFLIPISFQLR